MNKDSYKLWGIIVIIIVMLFCLNWFLVTRFIGSWQSRGTFGDMFGVVNAFFTGLAFAAVAITLKMQNDQLQTQQIEKLRSDFEKPFYHLLNNYENMKNSYYYEIPGNSGDFKRKHSYLLMNEAYKQIETAFATISPKSPQHIRTQFEQKVIIRDDYKFIERFMAYLVFIVKYILRCKDAAEINFYTEILFVHLSPDERKLLYLYSYYNDEANGILSRIGFIDNAQIKASLKTIIG